MKLQHLYFLLAAFCFATVVLSLFLNHQLVVTHQHTVTGNLQWVARISQGDTLAEDAGKVTACARTVVASSDVEAELFKARAAQAHFDETMGAVRDDIREHVADPDAAMLLTDLAAAQKEMNDVNQVLGSIISAVRGNKSNLGTSELAQSGKEYQDVLRALNAFRTDLRTCRKAYMDVQLAEVGELARFEWLLGGLAFLTIIGIGMYGVTLQRHMSASDAQARLQSTALEAAANAIVITDCDGVIQWVNPAFTTLTGYARQEVIGTNPRALKSGKHDAAFYAELWRTIKAGGTWRGDLINRRKDGSEYPEEMTITPVRGASGQPAHFIAIKQEITDRQRAEAALHASEQKFRTLIEGAAEGILVADIESRQLKYANPAICRMLGYTEEELMQLTVLDLHPTEARDRAVAEFEAHIRGQKNLAPDIPCLRKDGSIIYTSIASATVVIDGRQCSLGFFTDITEHKRAREALQKSEEHYRALVETTNTGFVVVDCEGTVLDANTEYVRLTGHRDLNEIRGRNVIEWTAAHAKEKNAEAVKRCVAQGFIRNTEIDYVDSHGNVTPIEINATVTERGGTRQILTLCRDITERKQAEGVMQQLAAIVESSDDAIIAKTLDGIITSWNAGAERLFGYLAEEVVGKQILNLIPPERAPEEADILARLKRGESVNHFETVRIRKDGQQIDVSVTISPIRDSHGRIIGASKIARDITGRKRAEREIRKRDATLSGITDSAQDAILMMDPQGRVSYWNPAAEHMLGHTRNEALGRNLHELLVPARYQDAHHKAFPEFQQTGHGKAVGRTLALEARRKDGREIPVELSLSAVQIEGGWHAVGIIRDITERKRAEERLQASNQHLQEALDDLHTAQDQVIRQERLSALGTMASGIAHDFNNSLTAILGSSELLLQRPEYLDNKEKTRGYIEMMNTAAQDAGKVVNRLREFYRPREQNEASASVDLNDLVNQAIALTQPRWKVEAETQGVSITVPTDLQAVPPVAGNAAELREALTNLIFNAVDAMPRGGTVTIHTYRDDGYVVLEIGDTGTGMTDEVRRRCLDPFFTTKGHKGTGLGLSMVYGIVQRHQGTIDIESEVGRGTTFILRLPVQTVRPQSEPSAQPVDVAPQLHVLVVDDEAVVRRVIGEYLKIDGHIVEAANSGRDGLEKFHNNRFDLVLVDRAMPDMNGDEVATAIKSTNPAMPVIMLTGFGAMMEAADEKPPGVDFIVGKPVTINALRAALSQAVASVN